ncbi:MAG: hypothetical protein A2138_05720 [Deltaproteobacteria bacterium RBG_16_71_12]|nr:MAG: hypothetical protein A2138_05720 [Deltaproteobacteria bacterium RBG_16_71_12]
MAGKTDAYGDVVHAAKKLIADAVLAREQNLVERVHNIDALVLEIVREVGRTSTEEVANSTALTESARIAEAEDLTAQHRERTPFLPSSDGPGGDVRVFPLPLPLPLPLPTGVAASDRWAVPVPAPEQGAGTER